MNNRDNEDWANALWSSLALEFLARAALARISPVLLADTSEKSWSNIYFALGHTPKDTKFNTKSIAMSEVIRRLGEILPTFYKDAQSFCQIHVGRRNSELHSGETPFDGFSTSKWHAGFYRACQLLLESMGETLQSFVGDDEAKAATAVIAAEADDSAKAVRAEVEAFGKVWSAKDKEERSALENSATVWATRHVGHRVTCPACGSPSIVWGGNQSKNH